jgi:transposase
MTLIACLAELGSLSNKQIAMLAGLAPVADDSGERQGVRVIWGGRAAVRRILYLAALSAAQRSQDMKAFYRRLIGKRKPPKVALVAVARKARHARQHPHRPEPAMATDSSSTCLTSNTDAPPLRRGGKVVS